MLENKIADKLKNHKLDPQSPDLFETIMHKRSKQNSKPMYWVMGTIAFMFASIAIISGSEHWGKLPADGKTKEQVIAIKAREKAVYDSICAVHDAIREAKRIENLAKTETPKEVKALVRNDVAPINNKTAKSNTIVTDSRSTATLPHVNQTQSTNKGPVAKESKTSKSAVNSIEPNILIGYKREKGDLSKDNTSHFKSVARYIKPIFGTHLMEDEAALLAKEDESDKKVDPKKSVLSFLIPRELNIYTGAYAQNRFANDENPLGKRINSQLAINNTQQLGFTAEYNLKRSVFAQVGLQWLGYSQSILPFSYNSTREWEETIVDPGGQTITVKRKETTNNFVNGGKSYHQFLEVPLSIGARFTINKRHLIQPQFGVLASFHTKSNGLIFNNSGTETQSVNGKVDRWNTMQASILSGVSYTYILGQRIGLYVHPNLRYSLNSQAKNNLQLDELNYMFGAQFGIKYILK